MTREPSCVTQGGVAMSYEMILYEKAEPVLTITLNRPQALNAINPQMTAELHQALDAGDADPDVRAIVLTGAGRAFSAGYDIGPGPDGRSSLDATGVEVAESSSRDGGRATVIRRSVSCTSGISRHR